MFYALALLAGIVAGSRALTAPAAVSWAARLGRLDLGGSWLAFMGYAWTPWIFTSARARRARHRPASLDAEPQGPDAVRRPASSPARSAGATIGAAAGSWIAGLVAGVIGAVIGTLGGAEVRARMAKAFGRDLPAALIEDAVAIVLGLVIVAASR